MYFHNTRFSVTSLNSAKDGWIIGRGVANDPYIILANYYYCEYELSNEEIEGLQKAINSYNNDNKPRKIKLDSQYVYVLFQLGMYSQKKGELRNAARSNLIPNAGQYGNYIVTKYLGDTVWGNSAKDYINLNSVSLKAQKEKINAYNGKVSMVDIIAGVFIHEIGHSLGGIHGDGPAENNLRIDKTMVIPYLTDGFILKLLPRVGLKYHSCGREDENYKSDSIKYQRGDITTKPNPDDGSTYGTSARLFKLIIEPYQP